MTWAVRGDRPPDFERASSTSSSGGPRLEGMLEWPEAERRVPWSRWDRAAWWWPTPIRRRGEHGPAGGLPNRQVLPAAASFATLRFNFRGVGESRGSFSGTDEHRDVAAAVSFLSGELAPGRRSGRRRSPVGLAG